MADLKSKLEAPRAFFDPGERHLVRDLSAMREVLCRQGWIQGMSGRPGRARCFRGAIYEVIDGNDVGEVARARVGRVIAALGFPTEWHLVAFNDTRGRTKEQVLARIDAALRGAAHG